MGKRVLLPLFIYLALCSAALAQRGSAPAIYAIQGTLVFDTARPPEDRIEVRLDRNMQTIATVRTNLVGEFQFTSLPAGSYVITINLSGYEDVSRIVEVTGLTQSTAVSIEMNPMFRISRAKSSGVDPDDADSTGTVDVKQLSNQYPKKAVQAYEQGIKENGKGEFAKAVQSFEAATTLAPDFYQAQKNLGATYLRLSRFQDAEAADRRASALNPKAAQPFINLGMCYIQESDSRAKEGREIVGKLLDDGMDALDQAIKLKPQFALSHYYLGTAYYKSGFYPEAEASLLHARDLDPALGDARVVLVNVYVKERRLKAAIEQIDAFIKEHPKADERKALEVSRETRRRVGIAPSMNITTLRQSARQIWESALERANPSELIRQAVSVGDGVFMAGNKEYPLGGRIIVVGAGKASAKMAQAIEEVFGDAVSGGLVVTKYGHSQATKRVEIVEAGHPIPDASGMKATQRLKELLSGLTSNDIVLCLISGGASALWPSPADGITLEQKQEVTSVLLRAGATIRELNAVRKHLSSIKGGQLARWAAPARVITFIMSDVIGDPLDFIGSGPTAPDTTSFSDALAIVQKYGVPVPEPVSERLRNGAHGLIPETPKPGDPVFRNVDNLIIANNRLLIDAAKAKAEEIGFRTMILGTEVEGEAKDIARFFSAISREIVRTGNPIKAPACVLAAGETTVTVRGHGLGGRNQEMALAWAIAMASRPESGASCFASIASDGTDGPTHAAGGLVDPFTCSRAVELGLSPLKYLRSNDSSNFLKATGDLIVTGPTKTNLMDLQILLVG